MSTPARRAASRSQKRTSTAPTKAHRTRKETPLSSPVPGSMAARIRALREEAGMSLDELYVRLNMGLPYPMWKSTETIRRIEDGTITEDKADPLYIDRIAQVFGVKVRDLSPKVEEYVEMLREQVNRNSAWSVASPAQKVSA